MRLRVGSIFRENWPRNRPNNVGNFFASLQRSIQHQNKKRESVRGEIEGREREREERGRERAERGQRGGERAEGGKREERGLSSSE